MSDRFERFFERLMEEEGGLSNDPADSGGLTKYGISKAAYPHLDIASLAKEQAQEIYRRDYHDPLNIGRIADDQLAYAVFDAAVNCGVGWAGKALQDALGAIGHPTFLDGKVGKNTLIAVASSDPGLLLFTFIALRTARYFDLVKRYPKNAKFLNGWLRRSRRCLMKPV